MVDAAHPVHRRHRAALAVGNRDQRDALEGAVADAAKVAVGAAVERGEFESRSALSAVVPAAMFRTMLGLDEVDTLRLLRWSDAMLLYGSDARKYRSRIPSLVRRARRRIAGDPAEAAVREAAEFFRGYFRVNRDRYAEAWVANSMITVAESGILDAEALWNRLPCPIVFDHMGRMDPKLGASDPARQCGGC